MTANPHLTPILNDWHALANRGYALLITAPWGAGKSYAVRDWLKDKPHIYVSLFGLDTPQAIEKALFDQLLLNQKFAVSPSVTKMLEGFAEKFSGLKLDLQGAYRKQVLQDLPKLIIFDDLERAAMPAPQLLSAINPYVDHKGNSVLLIANETELTGPEGAPSDYRRWREKVIGRTITLAPETDIALTTFLGALPEGPGKALLAQQKGLIRRVFDLSGKQNLRLLRQSCTELVLFLNRLPPHFLGQTTAMRGLIGDFLAVSVAWNAGDPLEQSDFDFTSRDMDRLFKGDEDKQTDSGWQTLWNTYSDIPDVNLDGRTLAGALAHRLIVFGHGSEEEINTLMARADAFHEIAPDPWRILWHWDRNDETIVKQAYSHVVDQLVAQEISRPDIILQVFGIFLSFAKLDLFDLTEAAVIAQAQTYLDNLLATGKIPASWARYSQEKWHWSESSDGLSYMSRETEGFKTILNALIATLETAQELTRSARLKTLLDDLEIDPERYRAALAGGNDALGIPNLKEDPVFLATDPASLATRIFALHPDRWHQCLSPFKDRIERQERLATQHADNRTTERNWLLAFRTAAEVIAAQSTPLERQQILRALRGYLAFLDPPSTETTPTP